jgi:hypothetical protein
LGAGTAAEDVENEEKETSAPEVPLPLCGGNSLSMVRFLILATLMRKMWSAPWWFSKMAYLPVSAKNCQPSSLRCSHARVYIS